MARVIGMKALAVLAIVVATAALLAESARAQGVVLPLPPEDQQVITTLLGPIVGQALPSNVIDHASTYFPLNERTSTYNVTGGRHAGATQTLGVAKVMRPNGNSAWRFEMSPSLSAFISPSGEDLMMPSLSDTKQGIAVITTPANPFVLKGMKPGETRTYTQQVAVYALDDPGDQEFSGSLDGAYTYVGAFRVTVPAGTFDTVLLRLKVHGKIGPVHTHDVAYYFLAPNKGVVAMISQEDARAFWIIHVDTTSGRVLASD
jgi:hypothetical protein